MITVKDFATLLVVGTWLLVTLSACENSKHAEIMSTEDLRARAHMATASDTDTDTERAQGGIPFDGESVGQESLGLSETFTFAPEPPPSPASPPSAEGVIEAVPDVAAVVPPSRPTTLPEGSSESPRVHRGPASDYVPEPPPQAFRSGGPSSAIAEEEIAQAEEPAPRPETQIAQLKPSDFVPEPQASAQEKRRGDMVAVKDSKLADVFFDFDQYAIRSAAVPVLEKNAALLKQTYKDSTVLIGGYCDERGTVEYNLELGKRRAQAVKDYLVDLGVEESRIQIVSYGKEKPFCTESKASCWQQNRRGHFVQRVLLSSSSQR